MASASACRRAVESACLPAVAQRAARSCRPEDRGRLPLKASAPLVTLKKRSEFLRIRGGARSGASSFLMEARARPCGVCKSDGAAKDGSADVAPGPVEEGFEDAGAIAGARFGLTVTKKLGNAVVRNRIRRRLWEALRRVAPVYARPGCDYVLIARQAALSQQFAELCGDLKKAFQRIDAALSNPPRRGKAKSRRGASR